MPTKLRPLTENTGLLLRAALLQDERAIDAWQTWWSKAGSLDGLDTGEFRLVPLVFRNLKIRGYSGAEMGLLQGIYRQTWYRNRIAEARLLDAVSALDEAGIDSLVLKGMALVGLAYGEQGLRPMNDIDLLVRGSDFRGAVAALKERGWRFAQGKPGEEMRFARLFHAVAFSHPSGIELDLHRHILEESNWPGADDALWEHQAEIELSGRRLGTISPTDHVLHLIVHGVRWDPVPPIRWIPDVVTLIRNQDIDWGLLVSEAERRHVTLAIAAGLRLLAEEFEVDIPDDTLLRLETADTTRIERVDFRFEQAGSGAAPQVARYITRYLRLTSRKGAVNRVRLFPTYLRAMWRLDSAWEIPVQGVRRTWIRARGGDPGKT